MIFITKVKNISFKGKLPAFCVSTTTGQYKMNGLIHHNSVIVSNRIIHALEHNNKYTTLLLDPKYVEFDNYKDMKGVAAVANTPKEVVEVLRIARIVMRKRNEEMAALGIKNIHEYKPKDYSGNIFVTGVDMPEDELIKIKQNGEEQNISAKALEVLVRQDGVTTIDICLNGKDWIPVNKYCVEKIYNDEMRFLYIVMDELAEISLKESGSSEVIKEVNNHKEEIISILGSIAQLGRSAGLILDICTQKPLVSVVPSVLRSNPLSLDTLVETKDGIVPISSINIGDKIIGVDDNLYNVLNTTKEHLPTKMLEITFSNGIVRCSGDHQWGYWIKGVFHKTDSYHLFENPNFFVENKAFFGREKDGVELISVREIEKELVKCITTDAPDNLFKIFGKQKQDGNKDSTIFTSNCGIRIQAGRANDIGASRVALDNTLGLTIDSTYPGAGIVQSSGVPAFTRFYFSKFSDLEDYYKKRGLDSFGFSKYDKNKRDSVGIPNKLSGEIDIIKTDSVVEVKIDEESTLLDRRNEQEWTEI